MKNEKLYLILLLTLATINLHAQDKTILVFDLLNQTLDSITNITYDTTNQSGSTPHYIGDFNSTIEQLEEETPVDNIFPNSEFTLKKKAALDYDLNNYPLRTSIKLFYVENDTLKNLCSGSMISEKHVLTAAHCLAEINSNILAFDSLIVCPVYNDGNPNSNFGCITVAKASFIKDWVIGNGDFAILELEESIGQTTGWIGIGYDETGNDYEDDIFYKFSYPSIFIPPIDPNSYNGDTIYYNYGKVNVVEPFFIGSMGASGIVGESGSSLIRIQNNELYRSYGVLTYSNNLRHSKITREIFHLLKAILDYNITSNNTDLTKETNVIVFPNPTSGFFQIKNLPEDESVDLFISDLLGRVVFYQKDFQSSDQIDISELADGQYNLSMVMGERIVVERVVKSGRL